MEVTANWLAAPVVVPLFAAAFGLPFLRWGFRDAAVWQMWLAIIGSITTMVVTFFLLVQGLSGERLVLQLGGYPAPFGITLVLDSLSALMLVFTAVTAVATVSYSIGTLDQRATMNYYPLVLLLLAGVNGAFLTGDLFNLYVFFEVLLMASFALLTLGGQIGQINGGIRYVVLNLIASTLFLSTVGIIYGNTGTLNIAHVAERMDSLPASIQLLTAGLLFVAFGSKSALFPLFFWLPSSYHTPHPAITAFFGGLLTKVGIYTLFRIFPLFYPGLLQEWQSAILAVAGTTMVVGGLGAMALGTMRRVLSYHIISQVGYMLMGLGLAVSGDPYLATLGLAAGIVHILHNMVVKTALIMAGGAAEIDAATGSLINGNLSGLSMRRPMLALLFFISAMSLAGIPPMSGFISKLGLLQSAVGSERWVIASVSMFTGFLTLMSMIRLWQTAFWGKPAAYANPVSPLAKPMHRGLTLAPIALLVALSIGIGLFGGPFFSWTQTAASQVLDRAGYIEAVGPISAVYYLGASYGD
jgi:multicomponent Na+:H+ antiporter subunit D